MQPVKIPLEVITAPATLDIMEMDATAQVNYSNCKYILSTFIRIYPFLLVRYQ